MEKCRRWASHRLILAHLRHRTDSKVPGAELRKMGDHWETVRCLSKRAAILALPFLLASLAPHEGRAAPLSPEPVTALGGKVEFTSLIQTWAFTDQTETENPLFD